MGNVNASSDAQRYRDGYPGQTDDPKQTVNLDFYQNKISSRPDGGTIETIHKEWKGKYGLLEAHHGYIQWLFPIREPGLNHHAEPLTIYEAKAIAADPVLQGRIVTSYELMLDFYGMKLVDKATGRIERADNWKSRYSHLNSSFHNYLRITRILKCLGETGLEHYKLPFVKFVLTEILINGELGNCFESCCKFWAQVLRNDDERAQLEQFIKENMKNKPQSRYGRRYADDSDDEENNNNSKPAQKKVEEKKEEKKEEKQEDSQATQPMDDNVKDAGVEKLD